MGEVGDGDGVWGGGFPHHWEGSRRDNPENFSFLTTREAAWYIISVVFVRVCMYLCMCVGRRKFIFTHAVYLHELWVKSVYEGHPGKVKVTGTKKVENFYSRNIEL